MANYFQHFPTISYNGVQARDITRRSAFIKEKMSDGAFFLPYTMQGNEKAEDIAHLYYGDVRFTWLVWLSNNIIDPYHEWFMDYDRFHDHIKEKYEEASGKKGWDVIAWAQNQTIDSNILFYTTEINGKPIKLSKDTHRDLYLRAENAAVLSTEAGEKILVSNLAQVQWRPYRVYEYEEDLNTARLSIQLVDKRYARQIEREFINSMKPQR